MMSSEASPAPVHSQASKDVIPITTTPHQAKKRGGKILNKKNRVTPLSKKGGPSSRNLSILSQPHGFHEQHEQRKPARAIYSEHAPVPRAIIQKSRPAPYRVVIPNEADVCRPWRRLMKAETYVQEQCFHAVIL